MPEISCHAPTAGNNLCRVYTCYLLGVKHVLLKCDNSSSSGSSYCICILLENQSHVCNNADSEFYVELTINFSDGKVFFPRFSYYFKRISLTDGLHRFNINQLKGFAAIYDSMNWMSYRKKEVER